MSNDFVGKITKALTRVGEAVVPPPESQDSLDAVLHRLLVSQIGRKMFETRYKSELDRIQRVVFSPSQRDAVNRAFNNAVDGAAGTTIIAESQFYSLQLTTKKGRRMLNETAFVNALRKKGVSQKTIDECLAEAKEPGNPSLSFDIVER